MSEEAHYYIEVDNTLFNIQKYFKQKDPNFDKYYIDNFEDFKKIYIKGNNSEYYQLDKIVNELKNGADDLINDEVLSIIYGDIQKLSETIHLHFFSHCLSKEHAVAKNNFINLVIKYLEEYVNNPKNFLNDINFPKTQIGNKNTFWAAEEVQEMYWDFTPFYSTQDEKKYFYSLEESIAYSIMGHYWEYTSVVFFDDEPNRIEGYLYMIEKLYSFSEMYEETMSNINKIPQFKVFAVKYPYNIDVLCMNKDELEIINFKGEALNQFQKEFLDNNKEDYNFNKRNF